jgi:hypothetical protein
MPLVSAPVSRQTFKHLKTFIPLPNQQTPLLLPGISPQAPARPAVHPPIHSPKHRTARAFTRTDAAVVVAALIVLGTLLTIGFNKLKRAHLIAGDQSNMRGVHQSMVIYAQNNNTYFPGFDAHGKILPTTDPLFSSAPGNSLSGGSMSARYYILVNRGFLDGRALLNSQEITPQAWKSPAALPTPDQFSFALLRIAPSSQSTDITPHTARANEWRDNANAQALLITDRNTGSSTASTAVRSVWSTTWSGADWQGNVVWGDNHTDHLKAPNSHLGPLSLTTKYANIINTNDFLFSSDGLPGKSSTASAMFGYTSENF